MPRRSKWMHLVAGVVAGVTLGVFLKLCLRSSSRTSIEACPEAKMYVAPDPLEIIGLTADETINNSNKTLVFVGVMTAEQYLTTRAKAVLDTWAPDLPGRIAFFSSEVSKAPGLPLVPLHFVDDSYPPQKKSFLMLLYMYENYGERFEWFMRADDDVYVRGDKLGEFLRSVDSRKPQFIGQAGRGTNNERDALALEYNENFCMGGPGVLISRETLRRVAPHVKYCLKHLYTTHEDVELGRCVAKFAGVSCTWSYDMQTILHHNGSGALAYTGRLKKREVHRAITLHPVKDHRQMYRLHTYFKNLRIQDLREQSLDLHRDISASVHELGVETERVADFVLAGGVPLFPAKMGEPGYLGNNKILGAPIDFNRYKPNTLDDIVPFDFISKSIYSISNSNPKRRIETPLKEALDDVIREVMEIINAPSRQRGRVIDFNELLYGYTRLQPLHGVDHILDLLLKYRRYRGRKMTAAVRRHAYLQQSFTGTEIRELPMGEAPPVANPEILEQLDLNGKTYHDYDDFDESEQTNSLNSFLDLSKLNVREALGNGLQKIQNNLPNVLKWADDDYEYPIYDRRIHFILPLLGRIETFNRFMKNYEDVILKSDETVTLIVVLYLDGKNPLDYSNSESLINHYKSQYGKEIKMVQMGATTFSRGAALTEGLKMVSGDDLVFFIDVDMMFNHISLRRIRINTIKYNQVYFPIVFSEFNPEVINGQDYNKFKDETLVMHSDIGKFIDNDVNDRDLVDLKYSKEISDDLGYFRVYGFGILAIYKCDFERVGGFDLNIKGWGMEDVQLFETLIKSNMTIYRIPDETLVHIFHSVSCDRNLEKSQFLMCLGTKASTYGSDKHMTYYMLNHPEVLWPEEEKGAS